MQPSVREKDLDEMYLEDLDYGSGDEDSSDDVGLGDGKKKSGGLEILEDAEENLALLKMKILSQKKRALDQDVG
jgi:hypothetical protein